MSDNKGKYRTEIQQVCGFRCVIPFAIVLCDLCAAILDRNRITIKAIPIEELHRSEAVVNF